jgi:hypothetical protein
MARRAGGPALVPLALAALLCLAGIGSKSLWGDEAYSVAGAPAGGGVLWDGVVERDAKKRL